MAASSSSSLPQHKVFINFRGEEVRNNFVAHLDRVMKSGGINAFTDGDDGVGRVISDLFKRIDESRIALAVFSSKYTESKWCLNELVRIKERVDEAKIVVIPIFYKVEPKTVKKLLGDFGDRLWKLAREHPHMSSKWHEALVSVVNTRGLHYNGESNERDFIDKIYENVKDVLREISKEAEMPCVIGSQEKGPSSEISTRNREKPEMCLMLMEQIHSRCNFSSRNNLDQVVKDKIASYAQMERLGFVSDAVLCTPGREVPSWFDHKAVGSELKPKLPPHWCDKRLRGIVVCAVASFQDNRDKSSRLIVQWTCKFKTEDRSGFNFSLNVRDWTEPGKTEWDYVFIGYISRSHIAKRLEEQGLSESIIGEPLLEFKVTDGTTEVKHCKVVNCGFTLVYASCFMVYASDLSIEWSENEKHWTWLSLQETPNDTPVKVAVLIEVYWLDIRGRFKTTDLTQGTRYEVAFLVELEDSACGWDTPVNVVLTLPTGQISKREVNLREQMRCQWLEIPAGEFVMSPGNAGEIEFSMYEHDTNKTCKKGLVVKGVAIRSKSH